MTSLRAPLAGGLAWMGSVAAAALGAGELTLVEAMVALALLVVIPAALPLHPAWSLRSAGVAVAAGVPAVVALLAEPGAVAAVLALPWLVVSAINALVAAGWWWRTGHGARTVVWPLVAGYLVVGAAWLCADRLGLEPVGIRPPFVLLTAVHFHYAAFTGGMVAASAWRWRPASAPAAAAAIATVSAPPIIAAGFTYAPVLQVAGTALLAAGLWLLAFVTIRQVAPTIPRPGSVLLMTSSAAVLLPMLLALQWALGATFGTPALSIPAMAQVHGVTNAVGFSLLGVLGWRFVVGNAARARTLARWSRPPWGP